MIAYGYFVNGPTPTKTSRSSKPGIADAGTGLADALEAGKAAAAAAAAGGKGDVDSEDDRAPLVRNVSKDSNWAGQNVVVMQVDHNSGAHRSKH